MIFFFQCVLEMAFLYLSHQSWIYGMHNHTCIMLTSTLGCIQYHLEHWKVKNGIKHFTMIILLNCESNIFNWCLFLMAYSNSFSKIRLNFQHIFLGRILLREVWTSELTVSTACMNVVFTHWNLDKLNSNCLWFWINSCWILNRVCYIVAWV